MRDVYGGPQGALLATASLLSLHIHLGDRLFRERKFDLRGAKQILDVGSGAGQIAKHLLKYADPRRSDHLLRSVARDAPPRPARGSRAPCPTTWRPIWRGLPFADESFDCVTCGYVLEHLPDARPGLAELCARDDARRPDAAADHRRQFLGAWTSRFWCCRTYNRQELFRTCQELGLSWKKELWFTRMHKLLRAGGICVEIEKQ